VADFSSSCTIDTIQTQCRLAWEFRADLASLLGFSASTVVLTTVSDGTNSVTLGAGDLANAPKITSDTTLPDPGSSGVTGGGSRLRALDAGVAATISVGVQAQVLPMDLDPTQDATLQLQALQVWISAFGMRVMSFAFIRCAGRCHGSAERTGFRHL
jgi:hypothetical protein